MVIDASALTDAILAPPARRRLRALIDGEPLAAPDLIDAEAVSAARGLVRGGTLTDANGRRFLAAALAAPIERVPCGVLAGAARAASARISAYDALYVALALRLETTLITDDRRLARACRGLIPTETLLT